MIKNTFATVPTDVRFCRLYADVAKLWRFASPASGVVRIPNNWDLHSLQTLRRTPKWLAVEHNGTRSLHYKLDIIQLLGD